MSELHNEVKQMIIDCLDLEDIEIDEIENSDALFTEGLGLDSIDALEIGLAIQKRYGIKLQSDSDETHKHFSSIDALVALIKTNRTDKDS